MPFGVIFRGFVIVLDFAVGLTGGVVEDFWKYNVIQPATYDPVKMTEQIIVTALLSKIFKT